MRNNVYGKHLKRRLAIFESLESFQTLQNVVTKMDEGGILLSKNSHRVMEVNLPPILLALCCWWCQI